MEEGICKRLTIPETSSTKIPIKEDRYIFIEHVPADVCTRCGEKMYTPEVTDALLRIARKELTPERKIEVPVYAFVMKPG